MDSLEEAQPRVSVGTGNIPGDDSTPAPASHSWQEVSSSFASTLTTKRVDNMVGSYLTNVTSSNMTCLDTLGMDASRKKSLTGSSKGHDLSRLEQSDARLDKSILQMTPESKDVDPSETASAIPGLSIITWDEFVEDPSLLHKLFTIDKDEFIHFDANIVNNFFHDSRMEQPLLGGPSGDGVSWTIFVDSYSQLKEVRDVMTSKISVLLVDLIKSNNQGRASCLIAINPMDDHIRRVLHLTLSRAMESVFNDRCFSIEIDLNENIRQWCKAILQMDCQVQGGRVVVTNGDAVEPFCLVESPVFCVLAFPLWLFRRVQYITHRKRHYDDTLVEFEGASFVLCTRSDTLRKHSEAMQLSNGDRLIHQNTSAVTTATQTLNTSNTSLDSELSVQEIEEASDNDVVKRREVASDMAEKETTKSPLAAMSPAQNRDDGNGETDRGHNARQRNPHVSFGHVNKGYMNDENDSHGSTLGENTDESLPVSRNNTDLSGGTSVDEEEEANILKMVAKANRVDDSPNGQSDSGDVKKQKTVKYSETETNTEGIPSPRSAFLLRPDTPFQPTPKPRKTTSTAVKEVNIPSTSSTGSNSPVASGTDINDKIIKRQKKISNLLKDLISFNAPSYNVSGDPDDDVRGSEIDNDMKISSPRYFKNNFLSEAMTSPVKPPRRTLQTPIKTMRKPETPSVFPYTSDLLNFPAMSQNEDVGNLEKYGARFTKKDLKKKPPKRTEDMLFMPRLDLEEVDPDRNCFSDQDVADSDLTDLEQEKEGAMSDTEGILSSRLIPVYSTERTLSMNSVSNVVKNKGASKDKAGQDSDLEITDCEVEDSAREMNSPRILPGAMAAQQLRSTSAYGRSRDYIPPNAQMNRRGGTQNDSRRRYLALNSLRRKAYTLALQSQIRNQKRPTSAELVSYNARPGSVTIVSKV